MAINKTPKASSQFAPNDILNAFPSDYYVIDIGTKTIIQSNVPNLKNNNSSCYRAIFGFTEPCGFADKKCICQQFIESNDKVEFVIENNEGQSKKFFKAKARRIKDNYVVAFYTDVTEEVLYQKELKINRKRLERAEKLADFGYWEFNIDDKIMLSSLGARLIYGVSETNLPLKEIQKIPLPEYRPILDERLKNMIEKGEPYDVQFKIRRKNDGQIRVIHSMAEFRKDKRMVFGVIHDVTDKTLAETHLKNTLFDLEFTQSIAKIGSWSYDPEVNKLFLSDIVYKIIEREKTEGYIPFDDLDKYFPTHSKSFKMHFEKAKTEGKEFEMQMELQVAPGKEKWIELICQPVSEPGPKGYFLRGSIQDISESIKYQYELNQSNELLRTLIDNIPDAIYMKDKGYRKILANEGDVKNSRVNSTDELLGKTDFDIYPEEIARVYHEDDRKVIEKGESIINREEILPAKNGNRWVLTTKLPIKDEQGNIFGLVGIGREITEIKEKDIQLRLLQKTVEQSPLSVVITNPKGNIEYVNEGFVNASGYSYKEVIGKNPSILKSGTQDSSYYKELWDTILAGNNWYGEFHNKRKDGTQYWESAVIAPIVDDYGKISHFVAIKEDITQMKQMIADLEIAKEKAIESDRLKTLFLANMSHEIRTPLNGILGFSSIICSGVKDPEQLEYYGQIIENSGKRLITVIDDIIDISMIQSNQLKIDCEPFEINELLKEIFVVYHTQNEDKLGDVEFNVEYCESLEMQVIYSDKDRIYQVFKNLLDNAFKFTEKGSIEFGCKSADTNYLELYVKDTGIGIEESKQKIIFDSFRQAEEGNSRKFEGSGLGLAIISGIVERLNGEIKLVSALGEGSTFYVKIPRNGDKLKQNPMEEKQMIKEPVQKKTIVAKRIVSFEDDSSSIEYLKTVVGLLGYNLVNFVYAQDGIEYIRNNKVDMVLMDVQLPQMSGLEATRILKNEFPDLPVLIQTAFAMAGDMEKAFDAGCDDYLSKPLSVDALKGKIKKYVKNQN